MPDRKQGRVTPLIFNDEPIEPGETSYFQFGAYADTLARLVASKMTRTPLTIGLSGEWGTGKTTLLRLVKARLDETKKLGQKGAEICFLDRGEHGDYRRCRTVWFNAWKYAHENEMMVALVEAILRQMRDDGFIQELYAACSDPKRPSIRVAEATLSALSQILSKGTIDLDLSKFQVESRFRENLPFLDEFQRVFSQLLLWYLRRKVRGRPNLAQATPQERLLLDQEGVLAIFIDDLDRCLPAKTVQVLEAIKLMVVQPGTIFVLAASERVVQEAIRMHYQQQALPTELGYRQPQQDNTASQQPAQVSTADHQQYLEKLIQVRFELPPIRQADVEPFVKGLQRGKVDTTLLENLPLITVGVPTNPRRLKTFINYVELQWALLRNSGQAEDLKREVLTRWLVLDAAERSFTDYVRQLPLTERPEFVQTAQRQARGEKIEKPRQYDQWPPESHQRLWNVLKQESFTFDVSPKLLDVLIHLSAPPVQARGEPEAAAAPTRAGRRLEERMEKAVERAGLAEGIVPIWVQVPAGPFLMGSRDDNTLASDDEKPAEGTAPAV